MEQHTDALLALMSIRAFGTGLVWTAGRLAELMGWPRPMGEGVVEYLHGHGYLTTHRGEYLITDAGHTWIEESVAQACVRESIAAFADEALTGITKSGKRSKLTRAALPGSSHEQHHTRSPEDQIARAQLERKAQAKEAKRLNITVEQFTKGLETGRVHICKGGDEPHLGVFDRMGDRWQSLCRKCRKQQRRK
ncbi:MAG: hypothetical protein GY832_23545 [Chloroflexi bacterium]|nr:hypothetical protein [Chloroflexota bacterium]